MSVSFLVMLAVTWTALGILAAAVFGMFASIQNLGARLDARFDALEARFNSRMDRLESRLEAHIERHTF